MNGKTGSQLILDQIQDVLQQLDVASFHKPLTLFSGATLGQHFRHILEFYQCLVNGANLDLPIDYASRKRNPLIERDVAAAKDAFKALAQPISLLEEDRRVRIVSEYSCGPGEERLVVESSVGRELMYAYDHAIHHLAIIKMGLQTECPHMPVPPNLGVAPSTVKYRDAQAE